jgi:hypothetical protein
VIDLGFEVGDAATIAVHEQQGFARPVDFVIELDSVVGEGLTGDRVRTIFRDGLGRRLRCRATRGLRGLRVHSALQNGNAEDDEDRFLEHWGTSV